MGYLAGSVPVILPLLDGRFLPENRETGDPTDWPTL
jgi:hypothetical protein